MRIWLSGALALAVMFAPLRFAYAEDEPSAKPPAPTVATPMSPAELMVSGLLLTIVGTAALGWGFIESVRPSLQGLGQGVGTILTCVFGCSQPPMHRPIEEASPMAIPAAVLGTVGMIAGLGVTIYGLAQVGADEAGPSAKVVAGPGSVALDVRF